MQLLLGIKPTKRLASAGQFAADVEYQSIDPPVNTKNTMLNQRNERKPRKIPEGYLEFFKALDVFFRPYTPLD